jgi:hypothetical protein
MPMHDHDSYLADYNHTFQVALNMLNYIDFRENYLVVTASVNTF